MTEPKRIEWGVMPRTPHGTLGCVSSRWGVLRIAAVINEALNPGRPRGATFVHPKPFTLEVYIPLPVGTDRVQKFPSEEAAKEAAFKLLSRFMQEVGRERD